MATSVARLHSARSMSRRLSGPWFSITSSFMARTSFAEKGERKQTGLVKTGCLYSLRPRSRPLSTRLRRWLRQVIQHLALHAFHFGPITAGDQGQFLGTAADAQPGQQIEEVGNPLPRDYQLTV